MRFICVTIIYICMHRLHFSTKFQSTIILFILIKLMDMSFNFCDCQYERLLKIKLESQKYLYSNMQSQEICQILKQILPELQAKIKADLKAEYQQRILQLQNYYQKQIDQLVQKQSQLKSEYESRQTLQQQISNDKDKQQLYKRVSILESQRKNWCKLQIQYQATIKQLTDLLLKKSDRYDRSGQSDKYSQPITPASMSNYSSQDFNSVSPIYPPPDSIASSQIQKWEKTKPKANDNLCKPFKKEKKQSKQLARQRQQDENNSLSKYIKSQNFSTEQQPKQHYHSVLSPPKQQQATSRGKRIFWDDNKKKQLLSLIKLN